MKYCHGNAHSFRVVGEKIVGPLMRRDGTEGWSVAWMAWRTTGVFEEDRSEVQDIPLEICHDCGFIFRGILA